MCGGCVLNMREKWWTVGDEEVCVKEAEDNVRMKSESVFVREWET